MRKLLFRNSIRPSINANCTDDNYESSPIFEFRSAKRSQATLQVSSSEQNEEDSIDSLVQLIERTNDSDFKNNILYYIAGYIVGKIITKILFQFVYRFMDASEWMEEENEREEDEQCHSDKENNESRKTPVKKNKTGIVETKKVKE
ncbi:unnamed protein product [Euphydryas editha]|uniref:Uncharacterized protein n=1 Tax=Euphydryas editha TaxID=104508 RepID=A0AAU9TTZ5_EUPED|nr:unnamed protein product [Euphydryas editha]